METGIPWSERAGGVLEESKQAQRGSQGLQIEAHD